MTPAVERLRRRRALALVLAAHGRATAHDLRRAFVAREQEANRNKEDSMDMTVRIVPNDKGNPAGKLADAELHFGGGPLEGLKLIGFSVWERRGGGRNVTFPARQYSVNGERRSFALLRPVADVHAQERVRDLILDAYAEHEGAERAILAHAEPLG